MNRNNLWKWIFVVLTVIWSFYEIYPPNGRDLTLVFQERAVRRDAAYTNIIDTLKPLQQKNAERAFGNLLDAIGTNDITRYFPFFEIKQEANPTRAILNRLQREAAGRIKRGLDLQGGTSFLVGVDLTKATSLANTETAGTNQLSTNTSPQDVSQKNERILSQAVEVLRRRVDKFGVAEPIIQPAGADRILIQLPGLSEAERETARITIQKAAYLEFRLAHPETDDLVLQGITEPGYEFLRHPHKSKTGQDVPGYLVKKKHELTGKSIKSAMVSRNMINNSPEIDFVLNDEGAQIFSRVTRENIGHQLAIVLDGELYSAPVINGEIGARGMIEGSFTPEEAQQLANVLENPLEAPVKIIESREVDPSLGKDSIRSGMNAALIGTIAVAGFMLVYYLFAGLVANLALVLNIIILMGVMCSIGTTLTLPGIAGIVLTIGMAVDANVLIFERIREELAAGKSMRGALAAGYNKAFGTIFDSNLTTLISSVILIFMGTGPVKGFGVTLTIGVTVSMFTALVVTRLIFDWLLAKEWLKKLPMLHIIRGSKIDFMKWAAPAFIASWLLIVIGNGYGIFVRGHGVLGVDFVGGDQQTYSFAQKVEVDKIRDTLKTLNVGDAAIQYQKDIATKTENLRITTAFNSADKVKTELERKFPAAQFKSLSVDKVGPTVGAEITRVAILASLLAMFGILVYVAFRYEFSFSVGAVVAIIHDILMTMGWFFLSGRELSAPIVAAILTIIGFSINDTIVIFDRIREDLKLGVRGTFKEVMNQALNQTLSRTIITSGTVFIATLCLYLFGGGVINDFAFTFLVGILTGTYSSIYIASALVLWWHKGERPKMGASQVVMDQTVTTRG
ncbi:MAG: protein translocase subunit SecD [Verrucomicrobia bacterium]|nr:protein translocase subunit SecD [Verrucomicrobiota bacterium]